MMPSGSLVRLQCILPQVGCLLRRGPVALSSSWPSTKKRGFAKGTQTHGGDDVHRVSKLVCDFSVTTNALGPVPEAVVAARSLLDTEISFTSPRGGDVKAILEDDGERIVSAPAVEHYPQREDAQLTRAAAEFFAPDGDEAAVNNLEKSLIFGNGASELIDLLARAAPEGPYCTSPLTRTQYKEYERACQVSGRQHVEKCEDASVACVVNPTNPTGDFVERADMEAWISKTAAPGSWVIVDESMLFWSGPDWHKRGVSRQFVEKMLKRHIKIFLVYSWTKIFSCTGLRIGSVICPSPSAQQNLQSMQVPWSVNAFARAYLRVAIEDREYLERTWRLTPLWREQMITKLKRLKPSWQFLGQPWTSWVWIDTGDAATAEAIYKASLACGCPVRHAEAGYNLPTFIRIAVRRPYDFSVLYQALLQQEQQVTDVNQQAMFGTYADVQPSVIEGVKLVHIDDLKPHENVIHEREGKLQAYIAEMPLVTLPAIIVDSQYQVVIDGHHRLELFRQAGMKIVPAVFVNYEHEDILVNPPDAPNQVAKETVISKALKGQLLPPKSTQHMVRTRGGNLMSIISLAPQIAEIQH